VSALAETRTELRTADGLVLEAAEHVSGDARLAAVVLHPHPQYGGDMDNHVVIALAGGLAADGASTLRFNFRGTGASQGEHGGGGPEREDVRTALAHVRDTAPDRSVLLAGYSFGAMVAAGVAADGAGLAGLLLVSPPLGYGTLPAFPAGLPVLAIAGDRDRICPADRLLALAPAAETRLVGGTDHGWSSGLAELAEAARELGQRVSS
jgi:uncharacterized protein